ncbi:hypothetical protein IL992_33295 [Microbispora sp. NEAU-D428]|uniref:hypothetical protein n=1 Tax=Microbispora sitophila TaxID=2771537 RepID=UPI0018663B78|nr:hypothetical protein [Microbispora sitophila]MBE3014019.1 hypothetical protein [Microbispora sitophila]
MEKTLVKDGGGRVGVSDAEQRRNNVSASDNQPDSWSFTGAEDATVNDATATPRSSLNRNAGSAVRLPLTVI